jgi:hypothetical protein
MTGTVKVELLPFCAFKKRAKELQGNEVGNRRVLYIHEANGYALSFKWVSPKARVPYLEVSAWLAEERFCYNNTQPIDQAIATGIDQLTAKIKVLNQARQKKSAGPRRRRGNRYMRPVKT